MDWREYLELWADNIPDKDKRREFWEAVADFAARRLNDPDDD